MVRLKVKSEANGRGDKLFQFLYGAIKRIELINNGLINLDFNSYMVRLKGCIVAWSC